MPARRQRCQGSWLALPRRHYLGEDFLERRVRAEFVEGCIHAQSQELGFAFFVGGLQEFLGSALVAQAGVAARHFIRG